MELKSNSERFSCVESFKTCPNGIQPSVQSLIKPIDHKWSPRINTCIGNEMKGSQLTADISDHLFSESPTINMQRTKIVHIESPGKFYVECQNSVINQMELNKYANMSTVPPTVDKNGVYLVQKVNDMNWYRAKLCSILSVSECLMFFIDYGSKHVVNRSK